MLQALWRTAQQFLKIKIHIIIWPTNSSSGYFPKRIGSRDLNRYLYTHVSSIIHNSQNVDVIQVSVNRQMDKQRVVCVCACVCLHVCVCMYIYDGILWSLREEILTYATTWMNIKDTMLSETNQIQKDKYKFHLYEVPRVIHIDKVERWLTRARRKGKLSYCLMGIEFHSEKFWKWTVWMAAQQYERT